ncbi:hypothetical protein [Sphingomonas sp. PB4P5]|uniref:hypothetical protein n=1 Tax=Parasphingomonas puruogangriensis TaxID=3096155 RepID=UPI002FC5FD60
MTHQPAEFQRRAPGTPDDAWDDEALDAFLDALPPCPGLPTTEAEILAADARARADFAAGRYHDHAVVAEWLKTWGRPGRLPFKEWLNARNA